MRGTIVGLFCSAASTFACAATFTFPVDHSATDHGQPLYVSDQTLISTIPSLKGTARRLLTCINPMFIPTSGTIEFAPVVTGDHLAQAKILNCQLKTPETLTCSDEEATGRPVVFDNESSESFALAPGTKMDEALEVFRAFRGSKAEYADEKAQPWIKGMPLRRIAREGAHYIVSFSDCGCSNNQVVEQRAGRFVVVKTRNGICI
ncbi:MAG: hypothetical protein JSS16_05360 [Proteobacteria bacterium]|nr:hypothetical protein [Pseudomonadota bacterium]